MKRWWKFRLAYRRKFKPDSEILEATITAHSIQDAKVRFDAWQIREWNRIRFVVLDGAKLEEVRNVPSTKNSR